MYWSASSLNIRPLTLSTINCLLLFTAFLFIGKLAAWWEAIPGNDGDLSIALADKFIAQGLR